MKEADLFAKALDLPSEERAAFLREACGSDDALRQTVEELLNEHDNDSGLLDQSVPRLDESLPTSSDHELPASAISKRAGGEKILYFGDYELHEEIDRGAMGVVYRAEQTSLKRTVAIKMIRSTLLVNEADIARFRTEAESAASLDHPNIVPIYEIGEHEEQHYFSMKLIEGGTLRDHLEKLHHDPKAAARLIATVAEAIHSAHQRGILHRDLKPGNILIDENGDPHVTDFGLAKQMESTSSATLSGQIMGTPSYMSPEQAEGGGKNLTTATDTYALGAILYEILTGHPPHKGDTLMTTLKMVATEDPKSPSSLSPGIDRDLETITTKCLSKDPAQRYSTAGDLAAELHRWLRGEPIEARPIGSVEKALKWVKRRPVHAMAAGVTILLLLTLGVGGPIAALNQSKLRKTAQDREAETRKALAQSSISLAEAHLREGDSLAMQSVLAKVPGEFRDPTWNYLLDQSDTSFTRIESGANGIDGVVAHPLKPSVFAIVDHDGKVIVLNVRTGERLLEFTADFPHVNQEATYVLAISADGAHLAVGGYHGPANSGGIVIHDAQSGHKLAGWNSEKTFQLTFRPDGRQLIQHEASSAITRAFDPESGELQWSLDSTHYPVNSFFAPDGKTIVLQVAVEQIWFIDSHTGKVIHNVWNPLTDITALRQDGKRFVTGNRFGAIKGMGFDSKNLKFGSNPFAIQSESVPIKHLAFTPDGSRLVSVAQLSDSRQAIHVWNEENGSLIHSLLGGKGEPRDIAIHPKSGELVVCGEETRAWYLSNPKWSFKGTRYSSTSFWHSDDLVFAPVANSGDASLVRLGKNGQRNVLWSPPYLTYGRAAIAEDRRYAAVGIPNGNKPILILKQDEDTITKLAEISPPHGLGSTLVFNPSATRLAFNRNKYPALTVASVPDGKRIKIPLDRQEMIHAIPDLGWLNDREILFPATCDAKRGHADAKEKLLVWDAQENRFARAVEVDHIMDILAIEPGQKRFAEAGPDKRVRIRDAKTFDIQQEFRAHDGPITALAWHPSEPILASASEDLTIRIWQIDPLNMLHEIRGPLAAPHSLEFSPSGSLLGCASVDGFTRIWDLDLKDETKHSPKKEP